MLACSGRSIAASRAKCGESPASAAGESCVVLAMMWVPPAPSSARAVSVACTPPAARSICAWPETPPKNRRTNWRSIRGASQSTPSAASLTERRASCRSTRRNWLSQGRFSPRRAGLASSWRIAWVAPVFEGLA
jgi:hypothetical protein